MIDWDRVKLLREEVGEEDFEEVVDIFLEEVDEGVQPLRKGDGVAGLAERMHSLKGSALNLGFAEFSTLCQTAETMSANGRATDVDLADIVGCYDQSRTVFVCGLEGL
ncbi:MAG: Hpt domain-containing protein [Pseudomonadota bacterium]